MEDHDAERYGSRVEGRASSGFPMSALRFGDFDGDGVTDVLAKENGRWAISSGAALPWEPAQHCAR